MPKPSAKGTDEVNASTASEMTFVRSQLKEVARLKDEFDPIQLGFAKNLVNPDLTDVEFYMFLGYANNAKLNPFNKEIIAVVYNKHDPSRRRVSIIVPRDGKRVIAARTGELEDVKTTAIYIAEVDGKKIAVNPWEGELWGATCDVTRKGKKYTSIVPLAEYDTKQNAWAEKKSTMIKKVAESQALSQAFPEILGGVYDDSEVIPQLEETKKSKKAAPQIENGSAPASDGQLETLKGMGADMTRPYTKQEAVDMIAELMAKKPEKEAPHDNDQK